MTLQEIVEAYIKEHKEGLEKELDSFCKQKTLKKVICFAGKGRSPLDKKFDHQRRISNQVLDDAKKKLQCNIKNIEKSSTFSDLYNIINKIVDNIKGVGPLYAYDTSLRIGIYLKLTPKNVYLHAGPLEAAKNLRKIKKLTFLNNQTNLEKKDFPKEFNKLEPREIESCLCIYKKEILKSV